MRLSRTVFVILSLIFQKLKRLCESDHSPFRDNLSVGWHLLWSICKTYTKYEVSSLSRSRDLWGTKDLKWVTWHGHAHFRDGLSSVGWDLLCSTHVLNLKCLRLPATKKWKATPNVKILLLSHAPFGGPGVTHRVRLWLDGKRVVGFLLAIIAILASSHGCGTIKRNLSKSAFSDGGVSHWAQILCRWDRRPESV